MKKIILCFLIFLITLIGEAKKLSYQEDKSTGNLISLNVEGDDTKMNWLLATDGSQYEWIGNKYQWGNLYADADNEALDIQVARHLDGDDIVETYSITNNSDRSLSVTNIGICTPFNDNYPDAKSCIVGRCNVHIWAGGSSAYVNALRMGGKGPHIGLLVTEGSISDYEIWERGSKKGMSNTRGVIALCLPDLTLKPHEAYRLQWRLFAHDGHDFEQKILERGGTLARSSKYVYEKGETAETEFVTGKSVYKKTTKLDRVGEIRIENDGTLASILVIDDIDSLIARRAGFILDRQQMLDKDDGRFGAFMVYDNEGDSILTNTFGRSDLDEGRERVGMGIFLAKYAMKLKNENKTKEADEIKSRLKDYALFIREKLQKDDYRTGSSVSRKAKNRGYNYPWVADFYFHMYELTGDSEYARHGYGTLQALYRMFGHGFYCIDYPVTIGLKALEKSGLFAERDSLLNDFKKTADIYVKNGLDFPKFEVNYEQSIVAPAVQFLCEMYLTTKEPTYLKCAEEMMPALEAFNGNQPHYRLNDIAIRHWDGYWFGKRCTYGDVFPHYWSAITAAAFHYYAKATGKKEYQTRAENIVDQNLANIFENGRATCAFVFPRRINEEKAHYADAYANDQDWGLAFYLLVKK